jgi:signal transduction histidine kinase
MAPRRSLLGRFVAFLALLVAALATASFFLVEHASRAALEDLYRHRLEQAARVLDQYGRTEHLVRGRELEAVLGSPRFLAALETGDPETIEAEIPTHAGLAEAPLVVIADPAGRVLWGTDGWRAREEAVRGLFARLPAEGYQRAFVEAADGPLEVVAASVVANNGLVIGNVAAGTPLSASWADDLHRLTGLDVLLTIDGEVLESSVEGPRPEAARLSTLPPGAIEPIRIDGERSLASRLDVPGTRLSVVFTGSVDRAVAPLMDRIRRLLILLGGLGAAVAIGVVTWFTSRRITRQIRRLVNAAERIARGDLDFPVVADSTDELGTLATEFDRMRRDLRRGREEVEAAHHARVESERMAAVGQMAAGIIHDFKNPMAVVMGTADLIAERHPEDERVGRQCGVIRAQVERMVALTRDLLEYARGEMVHEPEIVELAAWIEGIRAGQEEAFGQAGVALVADGPDGLRVRVDPSRMRRVVDNLLNNAREVSGRGDRVIVRWRDAGDGGVTLEVADQGPGVPESIRDSLFEPFVTAGKEGGSGLGLAVSRKIVEAHGARLTADAVHGGGARFVISLPAGLREPAPSASPRETVG